MVRLSVGGQPHDPLGTALHDREDHVALLGERPPNLVRRRDFEDLLPVTACQVPGCELDRYELFLEAVLACVLLARSVVVEEVLDRESALGSQGEGTAPGADREPFDPERVYRQAEEESVSFGGIGMGGLLAPLLTLSFWNMKARAYQLGETAGFSLLSDLQQAAGVDRNVRFHLMGHSFGCIMVSATLAGPNGRGLLARPVDSVALIQGALSLWSYCPDIPAVPGRAGYFHAIIADHQVRGPIVTTQSEYDKAVGRWYPLAAKVATQITYGSGILPKYGALGTFGLRGLEAIVDQVMGAVNAEYGFKPETISNLESTRGDLPWGRLLRSP